MTGRQQGAGAAAREAVHGRGLGRCDRCGGGLGMVDGGWHAHHRRLRAQGGTWALSNVAALCQPCHLAVHDSPWQAVQDGWIVPSYADPATTRVLLRSGWTPPAGMPARLNDDGTWTPDYPTGD